MRGLSLVAASGGHSSSRCAGLSLSRPLLLRSTGSRRAGSAIVAHRPSCSAACGIFPDQGLNPCPLHWQADSQPLRHQGSPLFIFLIIHINCCELFLIMHIWLFQLSLVDSKYKNLVSVYLLWNIWRIWTSELHNCSKPHSLSVNGIIAWTLCICSEE